MTPKTIGDCFYQIRNGANIKQGIVDGGFPITRIETTANDEFNRDRMGYAGITDLSKYQSYILEDGDLLMSHINSVQYLGRTVLYEKLGDEKIIHGINLLGLKANRSVVNPAFARYAFYSPMFRKQLSRITKKSVNQASFTVADLKKIVIEVPPLEQQARIVNNLNQAKKIMALRQRELETLDDLIKARFVELFGDPVSNPLGLPKKRLSELGSLDRGRSQHRPRNAPELLGGPYPLIQTGEVSSSGLYITEYHNTYSELGLRQSRMWKAGTLCITIAANIAQTAIMTFDACFPDSVVGFVPYDEVSSLYIHYWFGFFQKILEEQAPQVAQKNINLKILSDLTVIVPEKKTLKQFEGFVTQVDKSKFAVQKSLEETQKLFDSLMQQYFG